MAKEISIIRQEAQQVQNSTQVGENTAQRVGGVLTDIVDKIATILGATYMGVATPTTNPGAPNGNVFYFATQAGTYTNFGGAELNEGLNILRWNGTSWVVTNVMAIVQGIGDSEKAVMSQKAICDATGLNDYPSFDASTAYSTGDVVNYNGKLYKFTSNHTAGAWTGNDVKDYSIVTGFQHSIRDSLFQGASILQLLNDFDICNINGFIINKAGDLATAAETYRCSSCYLPFLGKITRLVSRPQYEVYPIIFYDENLNCIGYLQMDSGEYDFDLEEIEKPENAKYIRVNSLKSLGCKYTYKSYQQINDSLEEKVNKTDISYLENDPPIINEDNAIMGGFYGSSNRLIQNDEWSYAKIDVLRGNELHISNVSTAPAVAFPGYDDDDNYICDVVKTGGLSAEFDIHIPYNVTKIIVSFSNAKYPKMSYKYSIIESIKNNLGIELSTIGIKSAFMPIITWIDDDCDYNGIQNVKGICDNLGIKAVFAAINLNNEQVRLKLVEYQNEGHQIVCHGTGDHWKTWSDEFDLTQIEEDMISILCKMRSNNIINSEYMVYPYGAYNDDIELLCRKYFKAGIAIGDTSNHIAGDGRYNIHRIFITNSNNLDYYKNIIDYSVSSGDWLIFGTHSNTAIGEWDTELVTNVLTYAKEKAKIMTLSQALSYKSAIYSLFET